MQLWHRLSLEQKTLVLLGGLFLLATLNTVAIYYFHSRNTTDAREIVALQTIKVKVAETIENLSGDALLDENQKVLAERALEEYSHVLNVLTSGGRIPRFELTVNAAGEAEALILQDIKSVWEDLNNSLITVINSPLRLDTIVQRVEEVPISDTLDIFTSRIVSDIQSIPNPVIAKAKGNVSLLWAEWQLLNNKYLNFLLEENEEEQMMVTYVSIIFWVFNSLALLMLLVGVQRNVYQPLQELLATGQKVSKGVYNVSVKDYGKDEMGSLSKIFNTTASTLQSTARFLKALGEGKLHENIEISVDEEAGDQTIKSALSEMRNELKKIEESEKERKWISEGLATFGDLLRRNNDSIEKLSDKVTSSLVKYTSSLVGGIYLLNEAGDKSLELTSFYALDIKKHNKKSYKPGEGLVGQTFLEEDFIYLIEIPENYISITSGIGETSPKAILLVPLKMEDEVFGVIELASLREYKQYEIEFVRKLSEIVASTIQNVKINQRTKKLLDESQEMTEQMKSQEEEMRQNMEELSATQEEMARKEQEMTSRLEAINNTLALAEYNMDKMVTHANKNFALLVEHPIEELIGLPQKSLIPDDKDDINTFLRLWTDLKQGKMCSGEYRRKSSSGKIVNISATYTPVSDSKGEVVKVIELTEEVKQRELETPSLPTFAHEVEEQLKQNLEALEITNRKLIEKKEDYHKKEQAMKNFALVMEIDKEGNILSGKEELNKFYNVPVESALELNGINKDFFLQEHSTGEIIRGNMISRYFISRIDKDRFLFLLFYI